LDSRAKNCAKKFTFQTAVSGNDFLAAVGGVIGFAPKGDSTLLGQLWKQREIESRVYQFSKSLGSIDNVLMRVGNIDTKLTTPGSTKVQKITNAHMKNDWMVEFSEMKLNTDKVKKAKTTKYIKFDPTVELITFPVEEYRQVCEKIVDADKRWRKHPRKHHKYVKGTCVDHIEGPCPTEMPTILFEVNGNEFLGLVPASYMWETNGKCHLYITYDGLESSGVDYISIGAPALETKVITLDQTNQQITVSDYYESPAEHRAHTSTNPQGLTNIDVIIIVVCSMAALLFLVALAWTCHKKKKSLKIEKVRYWNQSDLKMGKGGEGLKIDEFDESNVHNSSRDTVVSHAGEKAIN
jgi:hypothetical protein